MSKKISEIVSHPEIVSGEPVFRGTRVPVQNLIYYLNAGKSINDFLGGFPSVSISQVIHVLEEVRDITREAA